MAIDQKPEHCFTANSTKHRTAIGLHEWFLTRWNSDMSDEVWKTLIEAVTAVVTMAMLVGFFAYMIHKIEKNESSR